MFRSRNQAYVYLCLFLAVLCFFYWFLFTGRADALFHTPVPVSEEQLYENPKDFVKNEEGLWSTSADPWLEVSVPRGVYTEITFDVKTMNKDSTQCTVYYCLQDEDGWFIEDQKVIAQLRAGKVTVALPEKEIDLLRLDLTNEDRMNIVLGGVSLLPKEIRHSAGNILILLAAAAALLIALIPLSGVIAKALEGGGGFAVRMIEERPKLTLGILTGIAAVVCFGSYLIGKRTFAYMDIGSDMVLAYQPFWFSMADDAAAGRAAQWTFNFGLGTSTLSHISWLLDPFIWPTLLAYRLFGFSAAQLPIAWMQALKLCLCAFICYDYLSEFSIGNLGKILASFAYGFCGFVVLWGQHYMFSTNFVIFTLMLLFLERSVRREKPGLSHVLLAAAVAWMAAKSYYFAYMCLLALAIYTVFRMFGLYSVKDWRGWLKAGLRVLVPVAAGLVISAALFLPQVYEVLTVSDRVQSSGSIAGYLGLYSPGRISTILARVLSNNLQGIDSFQGSMNYYEAEQLFFTSFLPLFLALYVFGERNWKRMLLRLAGAAALCLIPLVQASGYIMNAFVATFGRYTFVLMPACALITAKAADSILERKTRIWAVAAAAVFYAAVVVLISDAAGLDRKLLRIILAETLCLAGVIIAITATEKGKAKALCAAFVLIFLVNVTWETWTTTNQRVTLSDTRDIGGLAQMTDDLKKINEELADGEPELFRVEKTYTDYTWFNDAMIEDYYGISAYNATVSGGIRAFYRYCWPDVVFNADGIYIQFERDYGNAEMAALLGVRYLISNSEIEAEGYTLKGILHDRWIYENERYTGFARFYSGAVTADGFQALDAQARQETLRDTLVMEQAAEKTDATGTVSVLRPAADDRIEAEVTCTGDGWVFFPVPYESGWSARVNGEKAEIVKADYGFMALPVSEGNSTVTLEYHIPLLKAGILITAVSLAASAAVILLWRKRKKKAAAD